MKELRPMLAKDAPEDIIFPVFASPKLDGIRCMVKDRVALSRTLKMIPNEYIQERIGSMMLEGLDGELIVGSSTHPNVMQNTTSGVMTHTGEPDFRFHVFDIWMMESEPYNKRYETITKYFEQHLSNIPYISILTQTLVQNKEELIRFESEAVDAGYEGVITRRYDSPYKFGRSTAKEQYLLKIKRFQDAEAIVIGYEQLFHNENVATIDERGYTKRSSHQENKVPTNMLGALICRDITTGIEFNIGTGFTHAQRNEFWLMREMLIGKIAKYKFFPVGVKEAPRHPVFLGFRHKEDM